MPRPRRRGDEVCKAFGRDPAGRVALDDIIMKLVRINPGLCWRVDEYSTCDILTVILRPSLEEDGWENDYAS